MHSLIKKTEQTLRKCYDDAQILETMFLIPQSLIFIPFIDCGFHFLGTETLDELSDQEDIPTLPGVVKRGEKNTSKGVGGRIPLTYRAKGIKCKKSANVLQ